MPAPQESPPPKSDVYIPTPRQRLTIYAACGVLVACTIVLVFVPSPKVPTPARIFLAAFNLIAAAVLLLIVRQKSADPKK